MERISSSLIAPCGMNCGICRAHLREKNPCHSCYETQPNSPKTRAFCPMRLCQERKGRFCFDCAQFPCDRLKRLDKRYRTKYGMSEVENLVFIRDQGMDEFIRNERKRWESPQGLLCVHDGRYYAVTGGRAMRPARQRSA